jgi:hypothetical protein
MYITLHQIYILNCINLLVGTDIIFRSLGENILLGTIAFCISDHWRKLLVGTLGRNSLSMHWAEISLRQHRLNSTAEFPLFDPDARLPGKTGSILCFSMVIKAVAIA